MDNERIARGGRAAAPAGCDHPPVPPVPPGTVIPPVAAGPPGVRANHRTLSSGDARLVAPAVARLAAPSGLIVAAGAALLRHGART